MNRNHSLRSALTVVGALCGVLAMQGVAQAAQFTLINKATGAAHTTCTSMDGGMTMDPAGNLQVSCSAPTAASTGVPTAVPSCTVNSPSIAFNGSTTLTAACTNSASSWTWAAVTGGAPTFTNGGSSINVGPFGTAGQYVYSVVASNVVGPSASASGTVTVASASAPPPPPPPASGCSTTADGAYAYVGESKTFSLAAGSYKAYKMPILNSANKMAELLTVATTATPQTLTAQVAISKCAGDFAVAPECMQIGGVVNGNVDLYGMTAPYPGYCKIDIGVQYFANIRNVGPDGVTSTCAQASCQQSLEYFGDMR